MKNNDDQPDRVSELESRVRSGDRQAFDELFSLHRERLVKIIRFRLDSKLLGRLEPDDVIQDAYVAAWKRIDHFCSSFTGSCFVWLRLVAQQTLVDLQRFHLGSEKRDAGKEIVKRPSLSSTMTLQLFGHESSPSQVVMQVDMMDKVDHAIAAMDAVDQEILAIRHFEELSNKETAEVLGISQKASSIRYFRALKRLQEILGQYSIFLEGMQSGK